LSARWFPFAFQREVPLSKSPIVVAKERRGGAFGQAKEFRRFFPNALCSAQWIRHPSSHIQPRPNRPRGPTEWAIPHFPTHVLTQKQRAGVGKSGGDRDSSWAVVCRTLWPGEDPDAGKSLPRWGGRDDCPDAASKINAASENPRPATGLKPQDKFRVYDAASRSRDIDL
jgi:hypothetical protein